ncbi:MAG: hypothetical protein QM756_11840 [Polyangiaceae bacterium]
MARTLVAATASPGGFAFGASVSVSVDYLGSELGHFSTRGSIERALGRRLAVGRCDVIYSSAVLEGDARRLGRECQAHFAQIEHFFDVSGPERVACSCSRTTSRRGA